MNCMEIMDTTGHTTVEWDKRSAEQVQTAQTMFDSMVAKGFRAFLPGDKGGKIEKFDPSIEKMIFIPHLVGG